MKLRRECEEERLMEIEREKEEEEEEEEEEREGLRVLGIERE